MPPVRKAVGVFLCGLCFRLVTALRGCSCWRGWSPRLLSAPLSALWKDFSKKGLAALRNEERGESLAFAHGKTLTSVYLRHSASPGVKWWFNAEASAVPRLRSELALALLRFARYQQRLLRVWQLNSPSTGWIQRNEMSLLPHSDNLLPKGNIELNGSLSKWFFTTMSWGTTIQTS